MLKNNHNDIRDVYPEDNNKNLTRTDKLITFNLSNKVYDKRPSFSEFLILARNELGYTQEQMAEKFGIKQNTWSRYENGKRQVPIDLFFKITEMVGFEFVKMENNAKNN